MNKGKSKLNCDVRSISYYDSKIKLEETESFKTANEDLTREPLGNIYKTARENLIRKEVGRTFKTANDNLNRDQVDFTLKTAKEVSIKEHAGCIFKPANSTGEQVGCEACDNAEAIRNHDKVVLSLINLNPELAVIDDRLKNIIRNLRPDEEREDSDRFADSLSSSFRYEKKMKKAKAISGQQNEKVAKIQSPPKKIIVGQVNKKEKSKINRFEKCCHWIKFHCCCCYKAKK